MKRKIIFRGLNLTIGVIFFFSNSIFAYSTENNFWKDRATARMELASLPVPLPQPPLSVKPTSFSPSPLSLPPKLSSELNKLSSRQSTKLKSLFEALPHRNGMVRKIDVPKKGKSNKIVVHIQDVHMNTEAQRNIGQTIDELVKKGKIDLIGLEGSSRAIDLDWYRRFPQKEPVRKVADYLLKVGKISGPVHSALVSPENYPPLVGIDDQVHYQANVEAFKSSSLLIEKYGKALGSQKRLLAAKKGHIFNKNLLLLDGRLEAYHRDELPLGEYVQYLSRQPAYVKRSFSPTLETFLQVVEMESSINFHQVERERTQFLEHLTKTLSKKQTSTLLDYGLAYRLGQIGHAAFYTFLQDLAQKNKVPLKRFVSLKTYIQYVLLTEGIDADMLFGEVSSLENEIIISYIQTPQEKEMVQQSRIANLTEKLINFSLTNEEWDQYQELIIRNPMVRKNQKTHYPAIATFEDFYIEAKIRDERMTENLIQAMKENNADVAVLVSGGFHSSGITTSLNQAGLTSVTFVPQITEIDSPHGAEYLSVFAQEKMSLEELFEGDKLFLATPPMAGPRYTRTATGLVGHAEGTSVFPSNVTEADPVMEQAEVAEESNSSIVGDLGSYAMEVEFEGNKEGDISNINLSHKNEIVPEANLAIAGSSRGRFFLDPIPEALLFSIGPILAAMVVAVGQIAGINPDYILAVAGVAGVFGFELSSQWLEDRAQIIHDNDKAFEAAYEINPTLTRKGYLYRIRLFFRSLNDTTRDIFIIIYLSFSLMHFFAEAQVSLSFIGLALLFGPLLYNIGEHEFRNFLFFLGFHNLVPVPGSSTAEALVNGDKPFHTDDEADMNPVRFMNHFNSLKEAGDVRKRAEANLEWGAKRLRENLETLVLPFLAPFRNLDYELREAMYPENPKNIPYEDFVGYLKVILERKRDKERWVIGYSGTTGGGKGMYKNNTRDALAKAYPNRRVREIDLHDFHVENFSDYGDPFARYDIKEIEKFMDDVYNNRMAVKNIMDLERKKFFRFGRINNRPALILGNQKVSFSEESDGVLTIIDSAKKGKKTNRKGKHTFTMGRTPVEIEITNTNTFQVSIRGIQFEIKANGYAGHSTISVHPEGESNDAGYYLSNPKGILAQENVVPVVVDTESKMEGEILHVLGTPILKTNNVDASVNINTSAIYRRRRESKTILIDARKDPDKVERKMGQIEREMAESDRIVDGENARVTKERGYKPGRKEEKKVDRLAEETEDRGDPILQKNHFNVSGLQLPEDMHRAGRVRHLRIPKFVNAFLHRRGIDLLDLEEEQAIIQSEVTQDWIEQLRERMEQKKHRADRKPLEGTFKHPFYSPLENKKNAWERWWHGLNRSIPNVTLSVGPVLFKFQYEENDKGIKIGKVNKDDRDHVESVLDRSIDIMPGAQHEDFRGVMKGFMPFTAITAKNEDGSDVDYEEMEVWMEGALLINQQPFLEGILSNLAKEEKRLRRDGKPKKAGEKLEEAKKWIRLFFENQQTQRDRGMIERVPDMTRRYSKGLVHGKDAVVFMAPGGIRIEDALEEFDFIVDQVGKEWVQRDHEKTRLTIEHEQEYWNKIKEDGEFDKIPGFRDLEGYQLQYIRNIYTGEIFFDRIPPAFREYFVEQLKGVPANRRELEISKFGEVWDRAQAEGSEDQFRNPGISASVIEDEQVSDIERMMAEDTLLAMEEGLEGFDSFADYFLNKKGIEDSTPALVWASCFLHSINRHLDNGLFMMTEEFLNQLTLKPDWLDKRKERGVPISSLALDLLAQIRKDMKVRVNGNAIVQKPWEVEVFLLFLTKTLELPATWEELRKQQEAKKKVTETEGEIPPEESPYHVRLVRDLMRGALKVPVFATMIKKMSPSQAHLNMDVDPDNKNRTDRDTIKRYIKRALDKFKIEKDKGDKGEKILSLTMVAGSASRMKKGTIAKLMLDALEDDPHQFVDKNKFENLKKAIQLDDIDRAKLADPATFESHLKGLIDQARFLFVPQGERTAAQKDAADVASEKLKSILYDAKSLLPASKIGDKWYNFMAFDMLKVKKANDQLDRMGYGRPFVPGLLFNEEFAELLTMDLEKNNWYGFDKDEVEIVYQPMGYAVAGPAEEAAAAIREEKRGWNNRSIKKITEVELRTEDDRRFARRYAKRREGQVLYELGEKPEGHGWVFPALLMKVGPETEPPIVRLKRRNITE
ncbi:hypothetical protein BVX98_03430, partial [bacterium F11]